MPLNEFDLVGSLTCDIQGLGLLALPDVVVDLALHDRVVKIAGRVVDDHLRRVVADYLLLVDKPPGKLEKRTVTMAV